jgi:hypothetical protein
VFLDERLLPFAIPTPNLAHINIHGGREWLQFSPLNSSWHPPLLDRPAFHIEAWLRRLDSVAPHLTTLRLAGVFITLSRSLEDTIHLPTLQELAIGGDLRCCTVLLSALKIFPSCSTRIDAVVSYYRARERSETVAMWKAVAATILSASQNHVFTLKIGWEFVVQLWDHRPMPHFQFSLGFTKDIWPNPELYVDFVDLCDWLMVQLDDLVDRGELVVENVRVLKLDVPVNLPLHDLEGLELLLRKMARVPEVHFARFPAALWRRLNHHIHDGSEDLCVSYLIPSVTKIVVFACDESNNDSPQLLRVLGYLLDRQSNPQVTIVQECVIQHGPSWSLGLQAATVYENISRASQLTALAELVCDLTITSASLADLKTWIDPQLEVAANIAENVLIV